MCYFQHKRNPFFPNTSRVPPFPFLNYQNRGVCVDVCQEDGLNDAITAINLTFWIPRPQADTLHAPQLSALLPVWNGNEERAKSTSLAQIAIALATTQAFLSLLYRKVNEGKEVFKNSSLVTWLLVPPYPREGERRQSIINFILPCFA